MIFWGSKFNCNLALTTDIYVEFDGFYFDNLEVKTLSTEVTPPVGIAVGTQPDEAGLFVAQNIPNPTDGSTKISYTLYNKQAQADQKYVFELLNNVGQLVYSLPLPANEKEGGIILRTDELPKGVYLYRINAGNTQSAMRKLVVLR